jgi:hypothetical protein
MALMALMALMASTDNSIGMNRRDFYPATRAQVARMPANIWGKLRSRPDYVGFSAYIVGDSALTVNVVQDWDVDPGQRARGAPVNLLEHLYRGPTKSLMERE